MTSAWVLVMSRALGGSEGDFVTDGGGDESRYFEGILKFLLFQEWYRVLRVLSPCHFVSGCLASGNRWTLLEAEDGEEVLECFGAESEMDWPKAWRVTFTAMPVCRRTGSCVVRPVVLAVGCRVGREMLENSGGGEFVG